MNMKVYEGSDMSEIMSRIKAELGSDAVIFHSRKRIKGGIFGFFGREIIEVTAGTDIDIDETDISPHAPAGDLSPSSPSASRPAYSHEPARKSDAEEAGKRLGEGIYIDTVVSDDDELDVELESEVDDDDIDESARLASESDRDAVSAAIHDETLRRRKAEADEPSSEVAELRYELSQLQQTVEKLVRSGAIGGPVSAALPASPAVEYLLAQEVDRDTAEELAEAAGLSGPEYVDTQEIVDRLSDALTQRIMVSGPLLAPTKVAHKKGADREKGPSASVAAFIGPTGVGKTTTLAKLAARYALADGRDVALVTADFFRIAAIRQLKTYADITSVPFSVVHSREELDEAIETHQGQDIVLIDTAGHSQNNKLAMEELRQLLADTHIDSYHLVLSATSKFGDLLQIVERFGMLPISSFVLTKLDESTTYGPLLSLLWTTNKPVSYLTNGQRVPEDIQVATAERLSRLLISGIAE